MAAIWAKVDALLPMGPKALDAGFWGTYIFANLILLNKAHGCNGMIPPRMSRPIYLARYLQMDRAIGDGTLSPLRTAERSDRSQLSDLEAAAELAELGLSTAAAEGLIAVDSEGARILGWDETWGENALTAAERGRNYRERQKAEESERRERAERSETEAARERDANGRLEETRVDQTRLESDQGGQGVSSLKSALSTLNGLPDDSAGFRSEVEAHLLKNGWAMNREVPVTDRGDGKAGFVDLVASTISGGPVIRVGIELDKRTPRKKSIVKLQALGLPSVVILRGPWTKPVPSGLDAVIGISVAGQKQTVAELREAHGSIAHHLWGSQERMRQEVIPGSRRLHASDSRIDRVCAILAEASREDCEAVLRVYAAEAKRDPSSAKWFNGETNWRKANFDRALGAVGTAPAPNTGQAKPMARDNYTETGKQDLK